ncbi:MAG TPA: LytTR family DNA-binding domain-containing protein [Ruminococcus flavefaciens]|nr:LytTR family DNA-binding domain-containing protein [Ruminococcus flavefaciens]
MRIAICDDNMILHKELKRCLEKYAVMRKIDMVYDDYTSGVELLSGNLEYDIIFMDYEMDGINGVETAKKLRSRKVKTTIIFLSSFEHVVFEAFKVNAYRYLLKPVEMESLTEALDSYLAEIEDDDQYIYISTDDGNMRIFADDIIYAEASNKYCFIRTVDGDIMYKNTLSEFETHVPADKFFRCHRSFLVGFGHIESHTAADIIFDNQEKAQISKLKLTPFRKAFADYMKRCNYRR